MKDKFLLLGGYVNNAGPCNVNRSLIENSDGSMSYIKTASLRKIHRLENILKVIFYSNIVFSGGVPLYEFKLCKLLRKRTGLVVCDALNCGCALLMSDNVGATCIFNSLKEEDIIINNYNIGKIAYKIKYLLTESNFSRLFHSVDREKYSAKSAFLRLKEICLHE